MATVNQIVGGAFQDSVGNVLVNGTLTFELSRDSTVNTDTQVCAGEVITVPLNSSGSVPSSPTYSLWPNDVITQLGSSAETFYTVCAYNANGQLCWGPAYVQIISTPSPFDLGALVP